MFRGLLKLTVRLAVPVLVLAASIAGASYLMATAPETARVPEERQAPVVETLPLEPTGIERVVEAYGTVMPAQEIELSAEIAGRVLEIHPALEPGGIVGEGELVVRLDPQEYEYALAREEAALAEVVAALEVERGRQLVAQREWESFGQDLPESEMGRNLMLRQPQLQQAEARVASARSAVDRAKLDLARTEIRAPFDALVLQERVDVGQHVSPNQVIASLVGTDAFWVQASVPTRALTAVLDAAESDSEGVRVYSEIRTRGQESHAGRLVRHLGQVDPEGRMAQVLVAVEDPLALEAGPVKRAPLPLNSYVRVEIDAGILPGVVPVPRAGLRENNQVWIADRDNRLQVRKAEIVWRQDEVVAVRNTFEPGDRLIVSPLDQALPGMEVRPSGSAPPSPGFE